MKILFGMYLDGVVWSNRSASIGEVRTGPLGLLSILETRLGLSKPSIHPVHRINEYLKRLEETDRESAWFHRSFSVDPWSTARQLLEWRDELVEAGWQGNPSATGSPRLAALADLEFADIPLSAGRTDRLREVISCLEQKSPVHIAFICLKENVSMLPPVWQYVMSLLHSQGTIISGLTEPVKNGATNNLSCIQATMLGTAVQSLMSDSDDSLILLKAENEWEAAEHLALWLASDLNANNQVTIICGMDTSVLDQALRRHGLPCLGRSEPSRWREIQQILPLILANAWQPLDIHLLVELLSLTATPFPRWVCRYLLKAISKEPGVGGRAWNDALTQITALRKQNLADKGDDKVEENAREYIRGIQALLVEERFDPALGIPEDKLRERCQKIIDWLGWQLDGEASLEAKIDNIPFVGSADLLLRDRDGHPYILDMKWSSSSKYRRREVEEGSSLQLAAYAWMLRSAERAEQVSAGYYMLAQGELFSDSPTLTDEPIDSLYTLEDIWNRGVISMHDVIRQFDSGLIEARGVVESMSSKDEGIDQDKTREKFAALYGDRGMLYLPPPCGLCDFGRLCGLSGGTV